MGFERNTGSGGFKAFLPIPVSEHGFELTEGWVEDPSYDDYLAEQAMENEANV